MSGGRASHREFMSRRLEAVEGRKEDEDEEEEGGGAEVGVLALLPLPLNPAQVREQTGKEESSQGWRPRGSLSEGLPPPLSQ